MASELSEDMLREIFGGLNLRDLVRVGSVCWDWHGASASLRSLGRWREEEPQTPCLLYTAKSLGVSVAGMYSLAEKKPCAVGLPQPPIRSRHFVGSAFGWVITADVRSDLHLLNPVTGDQIALPPVTTFETVTPVYDDSGAVKEYSSWCPLPLRGDEPRNYALDKLRDDFFEKAFLSSDPSTGEYVVVVIHSPYYQLSFARSGDDRWTSLSSHACFADCLFSADGLMYAVVRSGEVHAFDFSGSAVKQEVVLDRPRDYGFERVYIVQTPRGDLLQVWSDIDSTQEVEDAEEPADPPTLEEAEYFSEPEWVSKLDEEEDYVHCRHRCTPFKLFKVDLEANKLVEMSSLGDNVLFLGQNQTLCLNAAEHPQLKAGHIYFTDNDEYMMKNMIRDIGIINLSDHSREYIVSPQVWSNWPSPVWISPNPRKMNSARGLPTPTLAQTPLVGCCRALVSRYGWCVAIMFILFSLLVSYT